jgi:RND family efflux transporter MFP subunit
MAGNAVRYTLRAFIVLAVIGLGVGTCRALISMKKSPVKKPRVDSGVLVETIAAVPSKQQVRVGATGAVVPARSVALSAEVAGRVVWMAPELLPGGRIPANRPLLRIDARDYRLAVEQQYALVDRARTELEVERGRRKIAEREWELLGKGSGGAAGAGSGSGSGGNLALREPQLRTAEVALKAAESGLERARLTVGKTSVSVPFNALVQGRNVDVGQLVTPGQPLATLIGTDEFWVQVLVPVDRLRWIDVPGMRGATTGSVVRIRQRTSGAGIERTGRVVRLMGDLDPAGRMARVLVAIDDPLGLGLGTAETTAAPDRLPLLVGAYVEVEIDGDELADVIEVPRDALHGGDTVFVYDDGKLAIRHVDIIWRRPDSVLIGSGLTAGDKIVVSPVPGAVEGMKLRLAGDKAASAPAPPAKAKAEAEAEAAKAEAARAEAAKAVTP